MVKSAMLLPPPKVPIDSVYQDNMLLCEHYIMYLDKSAFCFTKHQAQVYLAINLTKLVLLWGTTFKGGVNGVNDLFL
jgi:hypothetical protein